MFVRFILFFILGTFLINPIFGQKEYNASNNLKFKHFSTSDGLSQSSVIAIHQDKKGYMNYLNNLQINEISEIENNDLQTIENRLDNSIGTTKKEK